MRIELIENILQSLDKLKEYMDLFEHWGNELFQELNPLIRWIRKYRKKAKRSYRKAQILLKRIAL